MEHITNDKPVQVNITQKMPKQRLQKSITANTFILSAALTIAILVIASLFAEYAKINIKLSLKSLTIQAAMVAIGIFSIGFLIKKYSINEGRRSVEYAKSREKAKEALTKINEGESAKYIQEYCLEYSKNAQLQERIRLLSDCGISYQDFTTFYMGKSTRDIVREEFFKYCENIENSGKLKRFMRFYIAKKGRELTKTQLHAIKAANAVKFERYDPDFLRDNEWEERQSLVPSSEYNTNKANGYNDVLSAAMGILSSLFGAYLGGSIMFNFSLATLYMAIIETLIIFFNVVLKFLFGRKIVLMEIARYNLKVAESSNYQVWLNEKLQQDKKEE